MPKNKDLWDPNKNEGQEEKFRTFFTSSVVDIPDAMTRKDGEEPEKRGLFDKLFHRGGKAETATAKEDNIGEVFIGGESEEPVADLELARDPEPEAEPELEIETEIAAEVESEPEAEAAAEAEAEPEPERVEEPVIEAGSAAEDADAEDDMEMEIEISADEEPQPPQSAAPEAEIEIIKTEIKETAESELPAQPAPREPVSAPAARPEPQPAAPAPEKSADSAAPARPAPVEPAAPAQAHPAAPRPEEDHEARQLAELKALLNEMSAQRAVTAKAAAQPAPKTTAETKPKTPQPAAASAVFAAERKPEAKREQPVSPSGMLLFGSADDEQAAAIPTKKDDTMSIPLVPDEAEQEPELAPAEPVSEQAAAVETEAQGDDQPAEAAAEPSAEAEEPAPDTPEAIAERLKQMKASLTIRCATSGLLAIVLFALGLSAEGRISPIGGLDPIVTPAAFYAVNLVLYGCELFISKSVLRDGLAGLRGRPSAETMPALAAVAAAAQALAAALNPNAYAPSSLSMLSGIASLGLFMALLGNRVMLSSVVSGFELITSGLEQQGAYRLRDKDTIRSLSRDFDEKDPWVLLSQPVGWEKDFVEQCFDQRASERRQRRVSLVILAVAVVSGLLFLIFGAGINGAAASATAVLCMGAPLSSTLIAGVSSLRLQRSAGAVGAMVPGWAAIEELGGIDTVQAEAEQLFSPECVSLEDIRIFKGGRIDLAILYAASILSPCCTTLRGLFSEIIEERTDLLFPVKDLETHHGLGFSAWCDNNRVLIGTREYMEREEVPLPEQEYEDKHSRNGELQILYLAVSGSLHAMFVLKYQGSRSAARGMSVLQRENIRLLVSCQDPSLTAHHIAEAYRLPDWMVTLLDGEQCAEIAAQRKPDDVRCCMLHLKGFASLTGGLRAAEQAQNAENTATTVQIVSVLFSAVIALLLTSAGSIGSLSVVTVLMYQAAWSALSIAVCALKQRG